MARDRWCGCAAIHAYGSYGGASVRIEGGAGVERVRACACEAAARVRQSACSCGRILRGGVFVVACAMMLDSCGCVVWYAVGVSAWLVGRVRACLR